jgi:hypothetical protein
MVVTFVINLVNAKSAKVWADSILGGWNTMLFSPKSNTWEKKHANCNTNRKKVNPKSDSMAMK